MSMKTLEHTQHRDMNATGRSNSQPSGDRIYMDYASTTPCDKRVVETMVKYMTDEGEFGNPASRSHSFGWKADEAVEEARKNVADLIGADPKEIVFTSGATESDNLAVKGIAQFYETNGKHIVTSKIEHKAVLDPCRELEREGFEVTYLDPNEDGIITAEMVIGAVRDDTILVSIMYINNEMGTINDIEGIGKYCFENKIMFHVDAAQATGKIAFDLKTLPVHAMSLSAHKTYGPKGVGALYVRRKPRIRIKGQIHGGGHERGMRSGTLPTHQIVGMGEAFKYARLEMEENTKHVKMLHDRLLNQLTTIEDCYLWLPDVFNVINNNLICFSRVDTLSTKQLVTAVLSNINDLKLDERRRDVLVYQALLFGLASDPDFKLKDVDLSPGFKNVELYYSLVKAAIMDNKVEKTLNEV